VAQIHSARNELFLNLQQEMESWAAVIVLFAMVTPLPGQEIGHHPDHHLTSKRQSVFDEEIDVARTQQLSLREKCHAKVLQTCGIAVIEGFAAPDLDLEKKCTIRQDFLECMIRLKKRSCRSRSVRGMNDKWITALRQQILQLLWSARGCVLGIQVS